MTKCKLYNKKRTWNERDITIMVQRKFLLPPVKK